jgi:hypothetical protein
MTMDGVAVLLCGDPVAAAGMCWRLLVERKMQLELMENNPG